MNKKTLFYFILFITLFSTSYSEVKALNFSDGSTNMKLDYKIENYPKEKIFTFYIPNAIQYYYWKKFDKREFDKKTLKFISESYNNNSKQDINILVRTDFLLLKNRIIYSKKISSESMRNNKFTRKGRDYEKIQIF